MSDQAPDAISTAALASLLAGRGELPPCPIIPELVFADGEAGACDLQLALVYLIQQSATGANLIQILSAALYLLHRVYGQLEHAKDAAEANEPPYEDLGGSAKELVTTQLAELISHLATITGATEQLHAAMAIPAIERRCEQLMAKRDYSEADMPLLRSELLVSDELLASLGLERSAITSFLNTQMPTGI